MSKGAFALFAAGLVDVTCAGVLKALYKVLYAAGICDFTPLSDMFFPVQSIGFLLAGIGILAMLLHRQGKNAVYAAAPPVFSGTFAFVACMVLGLGLLDGVLCVLARKLKKPALIGNPHGVRHSLDQQLLALGQHTPLVDDNRIGGIEAIQNATHQELGHQKAGTAPIGKAFVQGEQLPQSVLGVDQIIVEFIVERRRRVGLDRHMPPQKMVGPFMGNGKAFSCALLLLKQVLVDDDGVFRENNFGLDFSALHL